MIEYDTLGNLINLYYKKQDRPKKHRVDILSSVQARYINPTSCLPRTRLEIDETRNRGNIFEIMAKSDHQPYPIVEEDPKK